MSLSGIDVRPVTPDCWEDMASLFGERGACGGCWCMWWRLSAGEFEAGKGEPNRRAMEAIVRSGEVPGLLAYADGEPVGWCSVAPREAFPRLARSRILRPVDDRPVWSIVCLFVARKWRRKGISVALLETAALYAGSCGATIVEGYAVDPKKDAMPDAFAFHGLASSYRAAGFVEVARRSPSRPIMRRESAGAASRSGKGGRQ